MGKLILCLLLHDNPTAFFLGTTSPNSTVLPCSCDRKCDCMAVSTTPGMVDPRVVPNDGKIGEKPWFSYGFLSTWLSGNSMGQFDIFPMRHQKTWRNFIIGFLRTQDHSLPIFSGPMHDWLVVSTPLKNISQLGLLFPIYGK